MIIGIGIDIISIEEIETQMNDLDNYAEEVFTPHEISYCRLRSNPYASFAGRFAAKEAFMKACGTGWTDDVDFLQIEVRNDSNSAPALHLGERARKALSGFGTFRMHLTLSHSESIAVAVVVLDK